MALPRRTAQIIDYLPTLYYQDPVIHAVIAAMAGRLAEAQSDLQQVMNAHWVATADDTTTTPAPRLVDLPRIAALVPLAPFPDEETTQPAPVTVLIDETVTLFGPGGLTPALGDLFAGQVLYVGGAVQSDGTVAATHISVGRPPPSGAFEVLLSGRLDAITVPTATDPVAQLVLLAGRSGVDLFRERLTLTIDAFLEGAGTAPAILKMVAATMGWGALEETFVEWSAHWTPEEPVFEAYAARSPGIIRLRELPLRAATTPIPHRVKSGARWLETNGSSFVVQPRIRYKALDQPVLIPSVVGLDSQVAVSTLVALETIKREGDEVVEQEVTLELDGQPDGTLRGTLIERRLPAGGTTVTDVSDRIRVRAGGLRVDREDTEDFLQGGSDEQAATLVISDGRRAIRLTARGQGVWGNAVQVRHAPADDASATTVQLCYDPALVIPGATPASDPCSVYSETFTLDDLTAGGSRLVTAEDFTFTIPEGESNWLYYDHLSWAMFDVTQWDRTVFDEPLTEEHDPDELLDTYPAKGFYDYTSFNRAAFPQEFLRAFRFDQPTSRYNEAFFNDTPEQVEVLLGWQEGQRAAIRVDVPLATERDRRRLAFLPGMIRRVKAAGIKVVLAARFLEAQPLGDQPPALRLHRDAAQPLDDRARLRLRFGDEQETGETIITVFDSNHWDESHFETRS